MTKAFVLWLIVAMQTVFLGSTLLFLIFTRARRWIARKENRDARAALEAPTLHVLLGDGGVEELADVLRRLKPRSAARHLIELAGGRLSVDSRDRLATIVRSDNWVSLRLGHVSSMFWWRRLDAARLLAVVARENDAPIVELLLLDSHAAVVSAIAPALARTVNQRLIIAVLDTMHLRPAAVRLQQATTLRHHWQVVEPLLAARLERSADPIRLRFWIELADILDSPGCLKLTLRCADHPSPEVRIVVARALAKCFLPETVVALRRMLAETDWRIRAQAARSLGELGAESAISVLADAMADLSWWVRFRSALALASLGKLGHTALRRVATSADQYASDMAKFVEGLPEGSRIELSTQ